VAFARSARRAAVVLTTLVACDAAPPPGPRVPEPTSALRAPTVTGPIPAAAKVLDWDIRARLDETDHRVQGTARLRWRNTSRVAVSRMPFHLYMNGFRAEDTAWMQDSRGEHRGYQARERGAWGYIDVTQVARVGAEVPGVEASRTSLRWAESRDPSLMEVELDRPVAPGETIELEVAFDTLLPEVFARTGHAGRFHMVGQWYPKPGVLGPDGTWHAHTFTFHSEFFADFGDYDVELDVPADMVVGATGIETASVTEGDRKRITWRAEMVHDFAWAADPSFVEYTREHDGVKIRQLLPPVLAKDAAAHEAAQIAALDSMQPRYGSYPWSTITIVHPPREAQGAGGMEYPTFYTTSEIYDGGPALALLGVEERISGVYTTVHEFGHQYFQGLLASDEHTQPWVDEGMNTFTNAIVLEDLHGTDGWLFRVGELGMTAADILRMSGHGARNLQIVDQPADAFSPVVGGYGTTVYRKTAALMMTLRNLVGHAAFDAALAKYAGEYRFGHPTGADLERVLVDSLGDTVAVAHADPDVPGSGEVRLDVRRFLEQALRTTDAVDFRVHAIVNRRALGHAGWRRNAEGVLVGGEPPIADDAEGAPGTEGVVVVHRAGDFEVPVEIEVELADGTIAWRVWSGRTRVRTFVFDQPVRRARLDPAGKLWLESRRLDNHRFAPGVDFEDGISKPVGDVAESVAIALLVGVGP
jgi:hypothetical protein